MLSTLTLITALGSTPTHPALVATGASTPPTVNITEVVNSADVVAVVRFTSAGSEEIPARVIDGQTYPASQRHWANFEVVEAFKGSPPAVIRFRGVSDLDGEGILFVKGPDESGFYTTAKGLSSMQADLWGRTYATPGGPAKVHPNGDMVFVRGGPVEGGARPPSVSVPADASPEVIRALAGPPPEDALPGPTLFDETKNFVRGVSNPSADR